MLMHEECLEGNFDSIKALQETNTPTVSYIKQVRITPFCLYFCSEMKFFSVMCLPCFCMILFCLCQLIGFIEVLFLKRRSLLDDNTQMSTDQNINNNGRQWG